MGTPRQRPANAEEAHELKLYALDLMKDPSEINHGKTIRWVLERLGLWEDEPCRD